MARLPPTMTRQAERYGEPALLVTALAGLATGGVLHLASAPAAGDLAFAAGTVVVLVPTTVASVRGLLRRQTGVDLIALAAMAGALALGEVLAAAIVAVMLTGGTALERYAVSRSRRELAALLRRAPRVAHRLGEGGVDEVAVDAVAPGDRLLVKPGEVVPVDGILAGGRATLDESALTGEARPVELEAGARIRSGASSVGAPFELRATATAAASTYAGIVRLVESAERSRAPFVRLADRYAGLFLLVTAAVAGGAWAISGDPVRALAVLIVATPCPLILAAPAAIVAGVSHAARHGILMKGGQPLEALARARILLLDKTGTLTAARPRVTAVEPFGAAGADEVVRLAASLEQLSTHPFAPSILAEARDRGLPLTFPDTAEEDVGRGIAGVIEGRRIAVGQLRHVAPATPRTAAVRAIERRTAVEGTSGVWVAADGVPIGALVVEDPIRVEAPRTLRSLREAGFTRIHLVTGDHPDIAELVGDAVGVDQVHAERTPEEKVSVVEQVRTEGPTVAVGDGINDAPALALADVGVAMGARGATVASEAADVVLVADRLDGLALAVRIARRTRRIAMESALVGMGLSLVAMALAAAGRIPPVAGALLQEGIDLLVIGNALRALGPPGLPFRRRHGDEALARRLGEVHRSLRPRVIEEIATLANRLDRLSPGEARRELVAVRERLLGEVLPHEQEEQQTAFPAVARLLPGEDPTGPLIRTHQEIRRLVRLYGRLVEAMPPEGPGPDELRDLRRALYGLHAVLSLHFSQEDELYVLLGEAPARG